MLNEIMHILLASTTVTNLSLPSSFSFLFAFPPFACIYSVVPSAFPFPQQNPISAPFCMLNEIIPFWCMGVGGVHALSHLFEPVCKFGEKALLEIHLLQPEGLCLLFRRVEASFILDDNGR